MKLAILIPTLKNREAVRSRMTSALIQQISRLPDPNDVSLIILEDEGEQTTGAKRNQLIDSARVNKAKYVSFFDDDDLPGPNYIKRMMEGIGMGVDCCSLLGQIYFSGKPGNPFHHSIKYDHWFQDAKMYYRNPNHLNCIKLERLEGIRFKDQTIGEDGHFSIDIQKAGVLKTEYEIDEIIYHYFTGRKDTAKELEYYKTLMAS